MICVTFDPLPSPSEYGGPIWTEGLYILRADAHPEVPTRTRNKAPKVYTSNKASLFGSRILRPVPGLQFDRVAAVDQVVDHVLLGDLPHPCLLQAVVLGGEGFQVLGHEADRF